MGGTTMKVAARRMKGPREYNDRTVCIACAKSGRPKAVVMEQYFYFSVNISIFLFSCMHPATQWRSSLIVMANLGMPVYLCNSAW